MIKPLLLAFIALITISVGCKSDNNEVEPKLGASIFVYKQSRLSTGEFKEDPKDAVIHIWKAEGRDLEIASTSDAVVGYAFDKITQKSVASDISTIHEYHLSADLKPGKYFLFVMLDENAGVGRFAYSTTTFEIKNEWISIRKVFDYNTGTLEYEPW